jgi:thiol:disulfide interchange protein
MERDYYPDPEVIGRMMKAIPVKVSGDEPANQPILSKYGVSAFPVIVFVNGDGVEFGRIEGCPPTKDEFLRALESRLK